MPRLYAERDVVFRHDSGHLVQIVTGPGGSNYIQRCDLDSFESVVLVVAEAGAVGLSLADVTRFEGLTKPRATVALEFLEECGLIEVRRRRRYAVTPDLHLLAMLAFFALSVSDSESFDWSDESLMA